jgi:hypothetical protein
MWKKLNSILNDKHDYHLDPTLKNEVEISDELLQSAIKYQKYLFIRKIKYFFEYDKLFFLRLFSKYVLKLILLLVFLSFIAYVLLLAFGIDINVNVKKIPKIDYTQTPVYIPSSGDIKKDSTLIIEYKKIINKNANYIIFYLKDPSKNYIMWKENLHGIESNDWSNPYEARRENSQYWGKYQLGESARKSINLSDITWEKWKNSPELQEAALRLWVDFLYMCMKPEIQKFDGTFQNGWAITESGIIAMAHNVGPESVKQFLYSGGKKVPQDGSNKDATRFLILGNYNLEIKK